MSGLPSSPADMATIVVAGFQQRCWRCHRLTTAIVGFYEQGDVEGWDLLEADEALLEWAGQLLPEPVRRHAGVGEIKRRYSRTVGESYWSNGCAHCDALQGAFPLGEAVVEALGAQGDLSGLVAVHRVQLVATVWDDLVNRQRS